MKDRRCRALAVRGACHTDPGSKPFAGGAAPKTAFGNFYAPDITPGAKTGIGTRTPEEFARAPRQSVRRARPKARTDEIIEATAAACCRALRDSGAGADGTGAGMVAYAQQVSGVLMADRTTAPARTPGSGATAPR